MKYAKYNKIVLFLILFLICSNFLLAKERSITNKIIEDKSETLASPQKKEEQETFMKGLHYYVRHKYYKAAIEWQKVLEINPENEKAHEYMEKAFSEYAEQEKYLYTGIKYFKQKDYKTAASEFRKTLSINPFHEKALFYLKLCLQKINEPFELLLTTIKKQIPIRSEFLNIIPMKKKYDYYALALKAFNEKKYDKAENYIKKYIKQKPKMIKGYALYIDVLLMLKSGNFLIEAEKFKQKTLNNYLLSSLFHSIAYYYYTKQEYKKALQSLFDSIKRQPSNGSAYYLLAMIGYKLELCNKEYILNSTEFNDIKAFIKTVLEISNSLSTKNKKRHPLLSDFFNKTKPLSFMYDDFDFSYTPKKPKESSSRIIFKTIIKKTYKHASDEEFIRIEELEKVLKKNIKERKEITLPNTF